MYVWIQIILLFGLYIAVIFYTLNYNKLFQPTKRFAKFEFPPTEHVLIDGVSITYFEFEKNNPTILFCHGNSGNISNRNYMVKLSNMANLNLVLFDYSGYGKSEGNPRTRRILIDGERALEWTLTKTNKEKLIIWGESLGGSIASYLASKNKCSKLILFSTFASLNDLAFGHENPFWIKTIQSFLNIFVHPLPTKSWIKTSKIPTLIIHSKDDELISISHARKMNEIDMKRIQLIEIEGGHGTPIVCKDDLEKIFEFCGVKSKIDYQVCLDIFGDVSKEIWTQ